jgi:hypothetical protein
MGFVEFVTVPESIEKSILTNQVKRSAISPGVKMNFPGFFSSATTLPEPRKYKNSPADFKNPVYFFN